jgi:hypothetical protein
LGLFQPAKALCQVSLRLYVAWLLARFASDLAMAAATHGRHAGGRKSPPMAGPRCCESRPSRAALMGFGNAPFRVSGAGMLWAVELYEPINTLKPVGEGLWVADGPVVRMAYLGVSFPFPTRMVVARIANGELFL